MRDYAGTFIDIMVDTNRQFVDEIVKEQELEIQADCQCNGGGFAYCEDCHGE
jgi:hypothetical protein